MFAELTVIPLGKSPVASLVFAIAALPLTSASTIVPSNISVVVTCPSLISAVII